MVVVKNSGKRRGKLPLFAQATAGFIPGFQAAADNSRRMRHLKISMAEAMNSCLSDRQRTELDMLYARGMKQREISHALGVGEASVSKSVRAALAALRDRLEHDMRLYDRVEKDFLREDRDN